MYNYLQINYEINLAVCIKEGYVPYRGLPWVSVEGRAGVRYLAHVAHRQHHALVELKLVDSLVVRHVQERLSVHFQDLITNLWTTHESVN